MEPDIQALRENLRALEEGGHQNGATPAHGFLRFGIDEIDQSLGGGLRRGALHEAYAHTTSAAAALALFAAASVYQSEGKNPSILWVRQKAVCSETGELHAQGLAQHGIDPGNLIFVRAHDIAGLLSAGLDAVRCAALGGVILECWGTSPALDLTATRRLALAADRSGVTPILLRMACEPQPSAAHTRWQVAAAPSRPLLANAPGCPSFNLTLLRNRAGTAGQRWRVEWDHERRQFQSVPPLSGGLVSVPVRRQVESAGRDLERTG